MKVFETFHEFHVFVFTYRAITENAELAENKIGVIFDWENLWKGIKVSCEIILRLFYLWRNVYNYNFLRIPPIPRILWNPPGQSLALFSKYLSVTHFFSCSQHWESSQQPQLWYHFVFKLNFEESFLPPKIFTAF